MTFSLTVSIISNNLHQVPISVQRYKYMRSSLLYLGSNIHISQMHKTSIYVRSLRSIHVRSSRSLSLLCLKCLFYVRSLRSSRGLFLAVTCNCSCLVIDHGTPWSILFLQQFRFIIDHGTPWSILFLQQFRIIIFLLL